MGRLTTAGESADLRNGTPREPAWHRRARRDRQHARLLLGVTRAVACLSAHHAQPSRAADLRQAAGRQPSTDAAATAAGCSRPPGGSIPSRVPAYAEGWRGSGAAPAARGNEEEGDGEAHARGWHDLPLRGSEPSYPAPPAHDELQGGCLEDAPGHSACTSTVLRLQLLHALPPPTPPQPQPQP